MIESKSDYKIWIKEEAYAYGFDKYYNYVTKLICGSESAYIWLFQKRLRKTEYYFNTHKKLRYMVSKVILNHIKNRYSLQISLNTCDKGLRIMHLGSVLMNGGTRVGRNVVIHINTSFVAKGISSDAPVIGDGCVIGVGAVIVGGVKIADNVAVGANSVVCSDILERNIAVAGAPAKKVSDHGRLTWNN